VKRDPNRLTGVRFSAEDAARVRQELERQDDRERTYQRLWVRFKRRRDAERAVATGGGMENPERRAA
jgi:hypothetical protein